MGILHEGRGVRLHRVNNISNLYKHTHTMGINKKMPTQEIGLYKMAKQAKEMKAMKKTAQMANAMSMAEMMKPIIKKKK